MVSGWICTTNTLTTVMLCPQGVTLIFSYIRRLGSFFRFKILNVNNFGGFLKNEYFWGYEDFVKFFFAHHKIGLHLGVISVHFRVFS